MNLTLHLTPEIEAKLIAEASATGSSPEKLALAAIAHGLGIPAEKIPPTVPIEQWLCEFDAWVSGHKSRNPRLDDSRESIYPDRW